MKGKGGFRFDGAGSPYLYQRSFDQYPIPSDFAYSPSFLPHTELDYATPMPRGGDYNYGLSRAYDTLPSDRPEYSGGVPRSHLAFPDRLVPSVSGGGPGIPLENPVGPPVREPVDVVRERETRSGNLDSEGNPTGAVLNRLL